jgi:hypothetical protein
MRRHPGEVIGQVRTPEERRKKAAFIRYLSPEQLAEVERRLSEEEEFVSEEEVRSVFARLTT